MTQSYRNSRGPFSQLRDEMDRLVTGFFGAPDGILPAFRGQPAVNVWEQNDALMVEMELPGVKSDQLDISVAGDELSVKVNRPETGPEGTVYHRRERSVGSFGRIVRLPIEVDSDRVQAQLRDGVLTITLPKAESAKPRKVNVTGA